MMYKQTSFVDLCTLKLDLNVGEYSLLFTSQGGKAHGSCEPHHGIVKHYKEHGNINCCIRSKMKVPIESIKVVGFLGSGSVDGWVELKNIHDEDSTKPFCKRNTHAGYRVTSIAEKDDGAKEIDYSGQSLKTNEPFELDIFSISHNNTSVIYCIIATIDAPDALDGELVKVISVPLCVHAKKSNGSDMSELVVYRSSSSFLHFTDSGVVSSAFLTVSPDNGLILAERRYKHVVNFNSKSVATTSLNGMPEVEVYTLSKERQNGQKKKEGRTIASSSSSVSAANRLQYPVQQQQQQQQQHSGYTDYGAINVSWRNEPEDVHESDLLSFGGGSSDTMDVTQVSRIVKEELQSCLINITRRLSAVGVRTKESLRSALSSNYTSQHSGLFSLQLLLSGIVGGADGTDVESRSNGSTAATYASTAAIDDLDLFDELLSLCDDESLAEAVLPSCATVSAAVKCAPSPLPVTQLSVQVSSPYVFGQTNTLASSASGAVASGIVGSVGSSSRDMKRQRDEEVEVKEEVQKPKDKEVLLPINDDLNGYYAAALSDSAQYETVEVAEVTSALEHSAIHYERENDEQSVPQKKLQKSKSNSNVCDYSRKCHV